MENHPPENRIIEAFKYIISSIIVVAYFRARAGFGKLLNFSKVLEIVEQFNKHLN